MKKILTIALVAATICGASASAQDRQCKQQCKEQTAQTQTAGDNNKMYQPREFSEFAFEGILLDMDQQTAINTINDKYKAQIQAPCHRYSQKPMRGNRPCKQQDCKVDSTVAVECAEVECSEAPCPNDQNPRVWMGEYVKEVKQVLTPEQYTTFLENIVLNCPQQQPRMHQRHGQPTPRDGRMITPQRQGTQAVQKGDRPAQRRGHGGKHNQQRAAETK